MAQVWTNIRYGCESHYMLHYLLRCKCGPGITDYYTLHCNVISMNLSVEQMKVFYNNLLVAITAWLPNSSAFLILIAQIPYRGELLLSQFKISLQVYILGDCSLRGWERFREKRTEVFVSCQNGNRTQDMRRTAPNKALFHFHIGLKALTQRLFPWATTKFNFNLQSKES